MTKRSMKLHWIVEDLVLSVEYSDVLEDCEWDQFIEEFATRSIPSPGGRILVYNMGGGPSAAQRARFDRRMRGKPMRIAVICTSLFTRAIIKAFHLMGFFQVSAFAPDQEEAAFRYLAMTPTEIARVRSVVNEVRSRDDERPAAGA